MPYTKWAQYSTWPGYIGPGDVWRRFMAGMPVTNDNCLADDSPWLIRPMTRYHLERLAEMLGLVDTIPASQR